MPAPAGRDGALHMTWLSGTRAVLTRGPLPALFRRIAGPAALAVAATALLTTGSGGCREAAPDPRTASPRAAAKAYAEAMTNGDADAIRQVSVGDDASLAVLA